MKRSLILLAITMLAGCSSFRLGSMLYVPHGAAATFSVAQPAAKAASAP